MTDFSAESLLKRVQKRDTGRVIPTIHEESRTYPINPDFYGLWPYRKAFFENDQNFYYFQNAEVLRRIPTFLVPHEIINALI